MAIDCIGNLPEEDAKKILEALRKAAREQEGGDPMSAHPAHTSYDNKASDIPPPEGATEGATSESSSQTGQAPTGTTPGEGVTPSNTTTGEESQRSPADEIMDDAREQTEQTYPGQTEEAVPRTKKELNKILREQAKDRKEQRKGDEIPFAVQLPTDPPPAPGLWLGFKRDFGKWFVKMFFPGGQLNSPELNSIYKAQKAADDYSWVVTDGLLTNSENFDAALKMMDGVTMSTLQSLRDAIIEEYADGLDSSVYTYMSIAMGGGAHNYNVDERKLAFQKLKPKTRTMLAAMRSQIDAETDSLIKKVVVELVYLEKLIVGDTKGLVTKIDEKGKMTDGAGNEVTMDMLENAPDVVTADFIQATLRIHTKMTRILKSMEASVEEVATGGRGTFIHRAYLYNSDRGFRAGVHANTDNIQSDARVWFAQEFQITMQERGLTFTQEQIDTYVEKSITAVLNIMDSGGDTSLHTTNSDAKLRSEVHAFKDLPDVPPAIRKMLGEIRDPAVNYAVTLQQQHLLSSSIDYAIAMRATGLKYGIMSTTGSVKQNTRIKDKGNSPAILMLSNLYTTPEIEAAIQEHFFVEQHKMAMKMVLASASAVKMGKTVLSPATGVRNWLTTLWILGVNAGYNVVGIKRSWEVIENILTGHNATEYVKMVTRVGVVGDGLGHQGLLQLSKDMRIFDNATTQTYVGRDDIPSVSKLRKSKLRSPKEYYKFMLRFYQGADDFPKVILFEKNRAMLAKAYGTDINNKRVIDEAAWRVKNTVFTYSKVPKIVKNLRNFPGTPPFISFPAEVIRTSYNWFIILAKDMASGNSTLQKDAALRIVSAGITGAMTAELIGLLAKEFGDMTDDLVELAQEMGGRFEKNQHIIPLFTHDDGSLEVLNMSRYNPYAVISDAVGVFFDPDYDDNDLFEKIFMSAFQLIDPFVQPDILAESLFTSVAKLTEDSSTGALESSAVFIELLSKGITPTVLQQAYRVQQTYAGESFEYGLGKRELKREALKMLGASTQIMDFDKQLGFSGYDYSIVRNNLEKRIRAIAKDPNSTLLRKVVPQVFDTIQDMERTNQVKWGKLLKDINILRSRGWSNARLNAVLRRRGAGKGAGGSIRKEEIQRALRGLPAPRLKYPADAVQTVINRVRVYKGKQASKEVEQRLLRAKKELGF